MKWSNNQKYSNNMKSVMIVYNQANTERVEYMLDKLNIKGFTFF